MGPKVSWKNSGAGIVSRGETIWTDLCEAIAVLVMLEKMVLKSVRFLGERIGGCIPAGRPFGDINAGERLC